jgi:hypothetical protein
MIGQTISHYRIVGAQAEMAEQTRPYSLLFFGIFSVSALAIVKRPGTAGLQVKCCENASEASDLAYAQQHDA